MKKSYQKSIISKLIISFTAMIALFIVHSCRKENTHAKIADPSVLEAKAWYEGVYPAAGTNSLLTQSTGEHDFSRIIKPDWQNAVRYIKDNQEVIEAPVDPSAKFISTFQVDGKLLNKNYSRSYYLLLKTKGVYDAYVLTIVADSDYVKNDLSKLSHNTYKKQDTDFSGVALYFTPRGRYLQGYAFRNGQMVAPANSQQSGDPQVQSVRNTKLKTNNLVTTCMDWYDFIYVNDVFSYKEYTGTTCWTYDNGGGSIPNPTIPSGGGAMGPPPPAPCQPTTPTIPNAVSGSHPVLNYIPAPNGCNDPAATLTVKNDLTDPCSKFVLNKIINQQDLNGKIANIIHDVFGTSDLVNITYKQVANAGNNAPAITTTTKPGLTTFNATVTLNMAKISEGSQEYKAVIMIHEALHAYMNYNNYAFRDQMTQHLAIAEKYADDIKVFIKSLYPSLPDNDAYAMILNGIADAYGNDLNNPNYLALLAHYNVTESQASFLFYQTGVYGTSCTVD